MVQAKLASLGSVIPDEDYDGEGNLSEPRYSALDEKALNQIWKEIYALVRRLYKNEISQVEAGIIIESALDYNYAPTRFQTPIARYVRAVEAILNGVEPEVTGREAGIEAIEVDDAGPRRELMNILNKTHKRVKSDFRKAAKALLTKHGYTPIAAVKIVHSCNRGEDNEDSELIGNAICDLYKLADENTQADIVEFLHQAWDEENLRGRIKKPLLAFNFQDDHPFSFIKSEEIARDRITLAAIADVDKGRVRRLPPKRGKKRRR